jgi:hypothetical protein
MTRTNGRKRRQDSAGVDRGDQLNKASIGRNADECRYAQMTRTDGRKRRQDSAGVDREDQLNKASIGQTQMNADTRQDEEEEKARIVNGTRPS